MMEKYYEHTDNPLYHEHMMEEWKNEDAKEVGCASAIAAVVAFIIALIFCALLPSCKSSHSLPVQSKEKDSVRVEVRTSTIYVTDTLLIEIPPQTAERTTADSTSHLENDYAISDARINADGTLFHLLSTKPQKKPVEVDKKIEQRDSIVYVDKSISDTGQQIVEVERNLSWWEQTRIYGFYLLLIVIVAIYRKPIWSLLKKFLLRKPH